MEKPELTTEWMMLAGNLMRDDKPAWSDAELEMGIRATCMVLGYCRGVGVSYTLASCDLQQQLTRLLGFASSRKWTQEKIDALIH